MALHERTEFDNGEVRDTSLNTYTRPCMADVPVREIEFVSSTETATGMGKYPTTVVGPDIGNAIFAAGGVRLRYRSIRPVAVRRALEKVVKV